MTQPYSLSDSIRYNDPIAANTNMTDSVQTGVMWRDGLDGIVKVFSASEFIGRVLGVTNTGEIGWVDMSDPVTAFGEVSVAQIQPFIQLSFLNGIVQEESLDTYTVNNGTVTFPDQDMVSVSITTDANSEAYIQSRSQLMYRPGQGSLVRMTCIFGTPAANSRQFIGLANSQAFIGFGYQNTTFGIFRNTDGKPQVNSFTATTGATSAANATVTLNSSAISVPLTNSANAQSPTAFTAWQIGNVDYTSANFITEVTDNVVYFISRTTKAYGGTYSYAAGSTGSAATVATVLTGTAKTENFVSQASWNGDDILDGSGASGTTLDPSKGNVYEIKYQWLGFGQLLFSIENPNTDKLEIVHTIKYANSAIKPSVSNPSGHLRLHARAQTTSASAITMKSACFFGGVEGASISGFSNSRYTTSKNLVNFTSNIARPVLSIRASRVVNNRVQSNVLSLLFLAVASDSSKPVVVTLIKNPTLGDGTIQLSPTVIQNYPRWQWLKVNQSIVAVDSQCTTVTGGNTLATFVIGKVDSQTIDLTTLDINLVAGDVLSVVGTTSNGNNDFTASLSWTEDQQ